jgi:DNA-binding response OmpR family regulator
MTTQILVIDDDMAITELMSMLLKTHGFDVITSNSGAEGIQLAETHKPHAILLDLMMPDVDGWQVCKSIRAFSNIPILVLSAINDPRMVASVLDAGADDFLVKPVPSGVLVAHIRKMVRRNDIPQPGAQKKIKLNNTAPLLS